MIKSQLKTSIVKSVNLIAYKPDYFFMNIKSKRLIVNMRALYHICIRADKFRFFSSVSLKI